MDYTILGEHYTPKYSLPLAGKFSPGDWTPIDLSTDNVKLIKSNPESVEGLTAYISNHIREKGAYGAFGGYGEKRSIYRRSGVFTAGKEWRSIHLGIDFWAPAGTEVIAPLGGLIHSFADNDASGDYGPTIIIEHRIGNSSFHSLYGHLSRDSLRGLKKNQIVRRGEKIAELGKVEENKDWPPHLHFQLIKKMEGKEGDYPGVCYESEKEKYLNNCPDPFVIFGNSWDKKLGLSEIQ